MTRDDLTRLTTDPGPHLAHQRPGVRRLAVAAARRHPELHSRLTDLLASDPAPSVRRECAEVLGRVDDAPTGALEQACADPSPQVREAAVNALGEVGEKRSVALLIRIATDEDEDRLVRESAVAALGAVGDARALPVLLRLVAEAPPQIRRRCVPALTIFEDDAVEVALRRAAEDRNPMVREAAEMVVGRAGPRSQR